MVPVRAQFWAGGAGIAVVVMEITVLIEDAVVVHLLQGVPSRTVIIFNNEL